MRHHVAGLALLAVLMAGGCGADTRPPQATPCRGIVDVSDSAAFVQYSVRKDRFWDVTLGMLQNPCAHAIDVVGVELGAAMGVAGQGASVALRPDQVFAAVASSPRALPPFEPFRVAAGSTVQVVGRFAVTGDEPVKVPTATLARSGMASSPPLSP